jgi:hypothetical protein
MPTWRSVAAKRTDLPFLTARRETKRSRPRPRLRRLLALVAVLGTTGSSGMQIRRDEATHRRCNTKMARSCVSAKKCS